MSMRPEEYKAQQEQLEQQAIATLTQDVENASNQYLAVGDEQPKQQQEKLDFLLTKIHNHAAQKKDTPEHKQLSIAVQTCALKQARTKQLKSLADAEVLARKNETLLACPGMCIQFEDRTWEEYYPGKTNIKYPDVRGLTPRVCKDSLLQRMKLFDLLQGYRQQGCSFQLPDLSDLEDNVAFKDLPAIIIPSGGKDGTWLGKAIADPDNFWWVNFRNKIQVIFVVSNEEIKKYENFPAKGVTLVGYDGFGMGHGRAVGVHVAKKLDRVCFMTDDRTKDLKFSGTSITVEKMGEIKTALERELPWITGVNPKGELNILTIINPKTTEAEHPNFSRYFIASKEDKALFKYCQALRLRFKTKVGVTAQKFHVMFDGKNPECKNVAGNYTGNKGTQLDYLTACKLYCSLGKDATPLDWTQLNNKTRGFLNKWDAIKMQDSAMYLLLEEIVKEMTAKPKELNDAFWIEFDKYIKPWFS